MIAGQESDYSEKTTSCNEDFRYTILQPFQFEPQQKKTCGYESHEKETTKAVVHRYSSKYVFLKISQISQTPVVATSETKHIQASAVDLLHTVLEQEISIPDLD